MSTPDLSDEEVDAICKGLKQSAAKIRHLHSLGLRVDRRPNGRPLIARAEWDRVFARPSNLTATNTIAVHGYPSNGPKWKVSASG